MFRQRWHLKCSLKLLNAPRRAGTSFGFIYFLFVSFHSASCLSLGDLVHIQSLLAAGAVWLNLGPPRQPEGCRGGPRCSQTAPATRRDCVYHHGTDTRLEQVKLEKNRTQKESFLARKNDRNFQPCEIANIRPRTEICNLTWLESADSVLTKQVPVQSSRVHVRSQDLATFIRRSDWSVPWLQTCDIW